MDWGKYNDSLVRRGGVLFDFSVMKRWRREVRRMNADKKGRPFAYPNSLIQRPR